MNMWASTGYYFNMLGSVKNEIRVLTNVLGMRTGLAFVCAQVNEKRLPTFVRKEIPYTLQAVRFKVFAK